MTTPSAFDLDIFRLSRPWSDYDLDVYIGDEWIASAKNNYAADEVAHESWHRALLTEPVIADVAAGNTDRDGDGGDPPDGPPIVIVEAPDTTPPESHCHTPLLDDLAHVLSLVLSKFVGSSAVRDEIRRVLDRYANEHFIGPDLSVDVQQAIELAAA